MKNFQDNNALQTIPGVGKRISEKLRHIGIDAVADLKGKDPEKLFAMSNRYEGSIQDKCLLYVYREAVYYAENSNPNPEKLKWRNRKDT